MIEWRSATHKDKRLLERFQCADPAGSSFDRLRKIKSHTEPWAEAVQKGLRNWRYRQAGREMWLGFEGTELVSAGAYSDVNDSGGKSRTFVIEYVSCAFTWRGRGVGQQCLGQLLAVISDATGYRDGVELQAFIHENNRPSQALFERFGFEYTEQFREPIREGSGKKRLGAKYGVWRGQL